MTVDPSVAKNTFSMPVWDCIFLKHADERKLRKENKSKEKAMEKEHEERERERKGGGGGGKNNIDRRSKAKTTAAKSKEREGQRETQKTATEQHIQVVAANHTLLAPYTWKTPHIHNRSPHDVLAQLCMGAVHNGVKQ